MPTTVTVLDSAGAAQTVNTLPALGQGLKAASLPVALASDQGTLAVSNASLPLPAGAATDATLIGGTVRTKLTDGTNNAAVKAASIAAIATDPALVVTISPNNSVAATQSGTWNIGTVTTLPALVAGSALIGKVGLDQTTPGTTNGVALAQIGANTILTGNGITGTGSQRVTIASDQTAFSVNAVQSGAWSVTNLSQFGGAAINLGAGIVGTGTLRTTQASDSPLVAVTGATTDLAVGNGTAGTIAGYLRSIKDAATDTTTPSPVKVDQTTPGTTNAVAIAQVGANTILTGNGVTGTGSQRVTIASDNTAFSVNSTLQTGANVIGALTANQSVNQAQVAGVTTATGNGVVGTGVQRVAIASDNTAFSVNSIQPALTKGTQGSTGVSTQDLKDAGRNSICLTAEFTFAQTAETLLTMTQSQNGGTTNTFTSKAIPTGKKFRIQSMHMMVESLGSGTTPMRAYLRLRVNTAGAATATSPLQAILACGVTTAIVKASEKVDMQFPEGLEFDANAGNANFGLTLETPDWVTTTATGRAKITVIGYEY